jgi:nifR3 family TIM-barrel protein
MRIGPVDLGERPLLLAPMEDVSDPPFRILCKRYGADMLYTEFISSGGLVHDSEDAQKKLDLYEEERPVGIQVFGGDVEQVRGATRIVDRAGADVIDINFGCPVRKVVRKDAGAGILRKPGKMRRITEAVIEEATRPVTVKTRLGWTDDTIDIINVARMLEDTGIQALAVHARTRSQMYKGEARWPWLRRLKEEGVSGIPLVGNGDALSPEEVQGMFDETGVDGVMIGRGAIGNPWIFQRAKTFMATGEVPPAPTWEERVQVVAEHLALKCEWLGERTGVLEMRKHYSGYFKGFRNASNLRHLLMQETEQDGVLGVLLNFNPDGADIQLRTTSLEGRAKVKRGDRSVATKKPAPPPALA